jgi:hypothetical protein
VSVCPSIEDNAVTLSVIGSLKCVDKKSLDIALVILKLNGIAIALAQVVKALFHSCTAVDGRFTRPKAV